MSNHDSQPKSEQKELLDSINFVYSGKEKVFRQVGGRYKDYFWEAGFVIGPDFKGDQEQKKKMYSVFSDVLGPAMMLGLYYDTHIDGSRLVYSVRIAIESQDYGGWFDEKAEKIIQILTSEETKRAIATYLEFSAAKDELKKHIDKSKL